MLKLMQKKMDQSCQYFCLIEVGGQVEEVAPCSEFLLDDRTPKGVPCPGATPAA